VSKKKSKNIGNIFVLCLEIDPIRSMYRKTLECGSFYCYPPNYNPPSNQSPDGIISTQESIHDRWGNAFKRYYLLETDFFMSGTVKNNLRHVFDDWKQCFAPELRNGICWKTCGKKVCSAILTFN